MDIALLVAAVVVGTWLLILVCKRSVWKQVPWFACYVAWDFLENLTQLVLWPINRHLYNQVYWLMQALEVALAVAAVRESFLRLFQGFTKKPGFRWSVWSVIGIVVLYSALKAIYGPQLRTGRLDNFVVGAEFLFRWAIFGIALLTTILGFFLKESIDTREDAIVIGFGVLSIAFLAYVLSFSIFGTKYIFFTKYFNSVGYFVAAFWWIWVFSRPVQEFGFEELGMGPADIAKALRRYREFGDRL